MGLAGQKRRTKISADPNNTNWAKSETNYGARLLAKSGWQPGQFLGAENANHSEHYTAANASHIRVVLREDNAGLGAIKGKSNAETFGLSTLSGIFGRLNGKSEAEVQKQADTQRDLELQAYQSHKWGTMNFVYGGLLVGDKMEEKKKLEEVAAKAAQSKRKAEDEAAASSSSKKRKHASGKESAATSDSSDDSEDEEESEDEARQKQKKKEKKKRSKKELSAADPTSEAAEKASKKARKEKRQKEQQAGDADDKARAKEEKRARKEARRKRREEKRQRKEAKGKASAQTSRDQSSDSSSDDEDEAQKPSAPKPAAAPSFGGSRHAVRQRYIMQKRQAGMNPQAMAEILMLKATA